MFKTVELDLWPCVLYTVLYNMVSMYECFRKRELYIYERNIE